MSQAWKDLPSPPALPVLGHWLEFRKDILGFLIRVRAQGPVASFHVGPVHCVLLSQPDIVHRALTDKAASFEREDALKTVARHLLGQGMITSEGQEHTRQRVMGRPAMLPARMPGYLPAMDSVALDLVGRWQGLKSLDLCEGMAEYGLRVASLALFGQDLGADSAPFYQAVERCLDALQPVPSFPPQGWMLEASPSFRADRRLIEATMEALLEGRRGKGDGSLLSDMVLAAETQGQSRERSREIALSVILAGSETTAMALAWTLYLLARHPQAQSQAREDEGGAFLRCVILESLRLYPPIWMLGRKAVEDVDLGGLELKRGELLYMSQFLIHRDERFFPDPTGFHPERWSPEFKAGLPPGSWLPFGAGPRACFGDAFAMQELMAAMAHFLRHFQWEWPSGPDPQFKPFITLRPSGGLVLQLSGIRPAHHPGGQHGS
jgi:cytochrome P450